MTNDIPASNAFINKYRPQTFDDVIGHDKVITSLKRVLKEKSSKAFLFTGPSGTGKTTLARIVAKEVGCHPGNIVEIDAATFSGVDDMRGVTEKAAFRAMHGSPTKFIIVDECHALSKAAVQSLLKATEEPPEHVYWALCTTEGDKVPEAIRTRCSRYELQPVADQDIYEMLQAISKKEKLQVPEDVLHVISSKSKGSPRRALSALNTCAACETKEDALTLLREVVTDDEAVITLCRMFMRGQPSWFDVAAEVRKLVEKDKHPESVRIVFCAYFQSVALNAKDAARADRALTILSAFATPYPQQSSMASLLISLGRLVFQGAN